MIQDTTAALTSTVAGSPRIIGLTPSEFSTVAIGIGSLVVALASAWYSRVSANSSRAASDVAALALDRQRHSETVAHRDAYYKLLVVDPSIEALRRFYVEANRIVSAAALNSTAVTGLIVGGENPAAQVTANSLELEAMDALNDAYFTLRVDLLLGVDAWIDPGLSATVTTELDQLQDEVAAKLEVASSEAYGYAQVRLALHGGGVRVIRALMRFDPALGPTLEV